jgi:hypothetical protein
MKKNGEALESFMGIWPSRRNFSEFQMFLRFGVVSDQLSAQPHNCRSNSEENFTQHWTTFVQFWNWLGLNLSSLRVSTFNLWCQRFHCTIEVLLLIDQWRPKLRIVPNYPVWWYVYSVLRFSKSFIVNFQL